MMHPAERDLLLDTAERLLTANERTLDDLRNRRSRAWDSVAKRALLDADIEAMSGEVAQQRALVEAVRALSTL